MKLSDNTKMVLRNFATINQNLVIKEGSELLTMSAMKNIVAKAEVEETFPKEIAIYDLNEFLRLVNSSVFVNGDFTFGTDSLQIEKGNASNENELETLKRRAFRALSEKNTIDSRLGVFLFQNTEIRIQKSQNIYPCMSI